MSGGIRNVKLAVLAAGDLAAAYLALLLVLALRYGGDALHMHWSDHFQPFTLVFAIWLAVFFIVGLYDSDALRSRIELAARGGEALIAAFLLSMAVFYFTPGIAIAPKTNLVLVITLFAGLCVLWRLAAMDIFSRPRFHLKALFLGDDAGLCAILEANPHLGYACLGQAVTDGELPECDLIIVSRGLHNDPELTARLYGKFFDGAGILDLPTFYEKIRHSVPESALDERWIVDNLAGQESAVYEHAKRLFDLAFAILFSVPALLLAPFIALAIWLDDRGPIFYRQLRVGRGGRPFSIIKFRTMRVDAEKDGATLGTKENDPRVTRVGRFIRSVRLDEIPQLWNILRGEMSFVGPRPERPENEAELSKTIPLFPVRHLVRPGLTGWAQVAAPYAATREDHLIKLRHDLYYLKYRSLTLDAAIVLKTAYSVFKFRGQ